MVGEKKAQKWRRQKTKLAGCHLEWPLIKWGQETKQVVDRWKKSELWGDKESKLGRTVGLKTPVSLIDVSWLSLYVTVHCSWTFCVFQCAHTHTHSHAHVPTPKCRHTTDSLNCIKDSHLSHYLHIILVCACVCVDVLQRQEGNFSLPVFLRGSSPSPTPTSKTPHMHGPDSSVIPSSCSCPELSSCLYMAADQNFFKPFSHWKQMCALPKKRAEIKQLTVKSL